MPLIAHSRNMAVLPPDPPRQFTPNPERRERPGSARDLLRIVAHCAEQHVYMDAINAHDARRVPRTRSFLRERIRNDPLPSAGQEDAASKN